jgi:hypothetical protein
LTATMENRYLAVYWQYVEITLSSRFRSQVLPSRQDPIRSTQPSFGYQWLCFVNNEPRLASRQQYQLCIGCQTFQSNQSENILCEIWLVTY